MSREERTHEYYERILLHTECKTAKGRPIKPIEYFDKIDAIAIPDGATNGDVLCLIFPNLHYTLSDKSPMRVVTTIGIASSFDANWWNTPYKRGGE